MSHRPVVVLLPETLTTQIIDKVAMVLTIIRVIILTKIVDHRISLSRLKSQLIISTRDMGEVGTIRVVVGATILTIAPLKTSLLTIVLVLVPTTGVVPMTAMPIVSAPPQITTPSRLTAPISISHTLLRERTG